MFRLKLYNPGKEFTLGISLLKCLKITEDLDTNESSEEECVLLNIGFLIFGIEIMW